jgi:hypothetical protein
LTASENRSKGARSRSSRSGAKKPAAKKPAAKKAPAKRSRGSATRKAPAKRSSAASKTTEAKTTRRTPAKPARKTAPKSAGNARPKKAEASPEPAPVANGAGKTAAVAVADAIEPSLGPPRRGGFGRWLGVGALLAGVVVVIVLIAKGASDSQNATVADPIPTITTSPPAAAASPTPSVTAPAVTTPHTAAPPTAKPVNRTSKCDPIVGSGSLNSGRSYPVTSSAGRGRHPADCGQAHSVLLGALSSGSTAVSGWSCSTDPSGDPIATCRSTGRTITARG